MHPELVNVSEGLKMHTTYPRLATPTSVLNTYLQHRMLYEKFDQERRRRKEQAATAASAEAAASPAVTDEEKAKVAQADIQTAFLLDPPFSSLLNPLIPPSSPPLSALLHPPTFPLIILSIDSRLLPPCICHTKTTDVESLCSGQE